VFATEVLNKRICSDKTLQKLKLLLEGVVEKGTAKNIRGTHYRIAGKTGTATILEKDAIQKNTSLHSWVFPANEPKYSAIVLIKIHVAGINTEVV
jgi:cell division protein FtsI (penicillin-binding protein 3)